MGKWEASTITFTESQIILSQWLIILDKLGQSQLISCGRSFSLSLLLHHCGDETNILLVLKWENLKRVPMHICIALQILIGINLKH